MRFFLIALALFSCLSAFSQRTVTFKRYGYPAYSSSDSRCRDSIQTVYGFREIQVAGCVVTRGQVIRWNANNRRAERKLRRRHGKHWRQEYEHDIKKCYENKPE